jgi:hypothetical protein
MIPLTIRHDRVRLCVHVPHVVLMPRIAYVCLGASWSASDFAQLVDKMLGDGGVMWTSDAWKSRETQPTFVRVMHATLTAAYSSSSAGITSCWECSECDNSNSTMSDVSCATLGGTMRRQFSSVGLEPMPPFARHHEACSANGFHYGHRSPATGRVQGHSHFETTFTKCGSQRKSILGRFFMRHRLAFVMLLTFSNSSVGQALHEALHRVHGACNGLHHCGTLALLASIHRLHQDQVQPVPYTMPSRLFLMSDCAIVLYQELNDSSESMSRVR